MNLIEKTYENAVKGIDPLWFSSSHAGYIDRWYSYIDSLPVKEKYTYSILTMFDQVNNGGFHQYYFNGYGQFSEFTAQAFKDLGLITSAALLTEAYSIVNYEYYSDKAFREALLSRKIEKLVNFDEEMMANLDQLDTKYYASEESSYEYLEEVLRAYLSKALY